MAQHDTGIGGQHRGQHRPGQAQKDEHPFRHARIIAGHGKGVRDIVEDEILPACQCGNSSSDPLGLFQRHARFGIQQGAVHTDINLAHGGAFDPLAPVGRSPGKGRDDGVGELAGIKDDGIGHIQERLQIGPPAAGKQRPCPA